MTLLAVTYATVFLLSSPCSDDVLLWTPSDAPDLAGYRVRLNGSLVGTPIQPAFTLGCLAGTACVAAVDRAGNEGASSCMFWEADPQVQAVVERPCLLGVDRPKTDARACTAPLSVRPQGE